MFRSKKAWPLLQLILMETGIFAETISINVQLHRSNSYKVPILLYLPFSRFQDFWSLVSNKSSISTQIGTGFRTHILNQIKGFAASRQTGVFLNSCFAHCQSERQDTWFANNSPKIGNKVQPYTPFFVLVFSILKLLFRFLQN